MEPHLSWVLLKHIAKRNMTWNFYFLLHDHATLLVQKYIYTIFKTPTT